MSLDRIVDHIAIPLSVARSLVIEGEHTARDLAYALTAAYVAAGRQETEDGKPVSIPGNGLRYALGRTRRDRAKIEDNRVERMLEAKVIVDGLAEPVALPSLQIKYWGSHARTVLRSGIKVRGDAQQQWHVDPAFADAMRPDYDEDTVDLPWTLLQGAKHKTTVPIMLRILAWIADDRMPNDDTPTGWKRHHVTNADGAGHMMLQLPVPMLFESLGLPPKSKPAVVITRMLEPAAREIKTLTGYVVKFTECRTTYRPNADGSVREGRLWAIRVDVDIPATITQPARPVARKPGQPWKPKPRFHKPPKPAEAPPAFVKTVKEFPEDYEDEFDDEPIFNVDFSKHDIPNRFQFGGNRLRSKERPS